MTILESWASIFNLNFIRQVCKKTLFTHLKDKMGKMGKKPIFKMPIYSFYRSNVFSLHLLYLYQQHILNCLSLYSSDLKRGTGTQI